MSRFTAQLLALFVVFAVVALMASGCSDDSAPRSVLTIDLINDGQILTSDVYNNGDDGNPGTDDDFILEDQVAVVIRNRPHDVGLNVRGNGPFGAVVLQRYEVRFSGEENLPPLFGSMHSRILSGSTSSTEVTVVPAAYKITPPLVTLLSGGEIRVNAEITLIGEEEDSGDQVTVKATLPVHCANWGDE
jgi:hypothetical protein